MIFAFSLAMGLACSEMPELLSFADDPSNDFVLSTDALDPITDRAVHEGLNCLTNNALRKAPLSTVLGGCFVFRPAAPTSVELLLFLSTQRN